MQKEGPATSKDPCGLLTESTNECQEDRERAHFWKNEGTHRL